MFDNRLRNAGFNEFVRTVGRATCLEEIGCLGWRDIFLKLCAGCTGCGKPTAAGQSWANLNSLLIRCWLAALGLQRRHKQEQQHQQQQPHPQNNNTNTNKNNNHNNNDKEDDNNNMQMTTGKNLT
ncbi:unnamed protein product [Polarella glacialis]|uniref:Uncharacterized protein n=1 Tax=Polarella glacialis TaxID=89957 RepID=A0A813K6C7_POLGL|nr:unnamed protein product [Polarella glacialis]